MNPPTKAVLAVLVVGLFLGGDVPAQRGGYPGGQSSKVKVPDDLGREPLDVAKIAIGGGDVDRALSVYQDILDRLPDRMAPVRLAPRKGTESDHVLPGDTFVGLRDYVEALIRAIPDGLKRYRERESPRAAVDLARALAARDETLLRRIVIRWELTESGPLALAALSDILFQSGRIAESRICADRLLALTADPTLAPEIKARAALRAAVAHAALQQPDAIKALGSVLVNGDSSLAVLWRGKQTPMSTVLEQLQAEAEKAPAPVRFEKTPASFARPSWQSRPFSRPEPDDETYRSLDMWVPPPITNYFPVIPVVSDSAVYLCDGLRIEGLSLLTGRPLWDPVVSEMRDFQGSRHWNLMHEVVLDRGVLYGCLEDVPDMKAERVTVMGGFRPRETIAVRKLWAVDANTGDVKWSHSRPEGLRDAEEREFFDRISVNTAPLVIGDRIYVGASYYYGGFRQWLCAFDRETGGLVWRTYICQGQAELNMFGNPVREVVPGYVGEKDGILVYSTNIGVVAAVDAVTGTPHWVVAYEQESIPSNDGQRTALRPPGWTVTRPLFYAGRAIIAPSDAFDVFVFNLDTGEYRPIPGARRTSATQFRHVVGIYDDALILAGRKVHAFDLKGLVNGQDPRPKWEAPPEGALTGDATIDGRPAVAGDRLFYTGRGSMRGSRAAPSYVACIDVRSGRILDERQVDGVVGFRGNIVFSADAVVVAGHELFAIFDEKEVARRIDAGITKDPEDARLRLRAGRIALQGRNFDRAVAELEKARALATAGSSRDDEVANAASRALYDLMLELATDPVETPNVPAGPRARFEKTLTFAATPRQQVQVLQRELVWAKKAGETSVVSEVAARLLNEFPDERLRIDAETAGAMPELAIGTEIKAGLLAAIVAATTQWSQERHAEAIALFQQALLRYPDDALAGPGGPVSVWRYGYAKIAEIMRTKGAASYAAEERGAEALLEEGRKAGNMDALRTLLDRYPNSKHVEAAWLELSRRLREAGKDRDALRAVQRQLARYGTVTVALLFELERALESANAIESARDVLVTLRDRFAKESVDVDGKPTPVTEYVAQRLKSDRFRELSEPPPIPEGTIGLRPAWVENPTAAGDDVVLVVPEGRRPKVADGLLFVHRDGELRAVDIGTGRIKWSKGARLIGDHARPQWQDGRLLAILDGDLAALDPATGKEHWRVGPLSMRVLAMHAAHGKAYVLQRSGLGSRTVTIRAFDIVTGEKLREQELPAQGSGDSSSLASSPLWLLLRLDALSGSTDTKVLDGITGEIVYSQLSGQTWLPAMLTSNDLLVTQTATPAGLNKDVSIVARNPKTQQPVWSFKLDKVVSPIQPIALSRRLAVFGARLAGADRNQGRRDIIALDLENGTTRMSIPVKPGETTQDGGVIAGDILLVKLQLLDGKRFIRAYDLKKSAFLWDSVTYGGASPTLAVHATRNYAIVRVGTKTGTKESGEKRTDMIHFFENRTGLLKDSITLENTQYRTDQADIDIRDAVLILKGGSEVSVRK